MTVFYKIQFASYLSLLLHVLPSFASNRLGFAILALLNCPKSTAFNRPKYESQLSEVDFLVTVDKKPWFAVEAKRSEEEVSRSLVYYKEKLNVPFVYQILEKPNVDRHKNGIRVVSADKFLAALV